MAARKPSRLEWPCAKRPRRITFTPNEENGRSDPQNRLWTDRFFPQNPSELAVAPKKVKEVSNWLQEPSSHLLILVGAPGVGKSTMVRCLAHEQQINLAEWSETTSTNGLNSFEEFLHHANLLSEQKSIILVDELPNLFANEVRFRELLTRHVRTTLTPTILIISDTVEGRTNSIDHLIEDTTLYDSSFVKIMQIRTPTKARFNKALKKNLSSFHTDSLFEKTGGDLRYALCMIQSGCQPHFRDTKLSSFHALGKLLYAKRNASGELSFDPEVVMNSMESVSHALSFLQYHSLEFYTDIVDLSNAMQSFSDVATLERSQASVAASLVARTVAATNRNPAATKFKQLSAPPKTTPNDDIRSLYSTQRIVLPMTTFATDIVPFLRRINPNVCWTQYVKNSEGKEMIHQQELENQRELLFKDDIVDDSD